MSGRRSLSSRNAGATTVGLAAWFVAFVALPATTPLQVRVLLLALAAQRSETR